MSLFMLKSIVTTVILVLALMQALSMAQVRGYVSLLTIEKKQLRRFHRWGGIAVLVLTVAVAVTCLSSSDYGFYSLRVWLHVVMGVLAMLVLLLKAAITRRFRRYLRSTLALGAATGLLILGTFVFSALWYFAEEIAAPTTEQGEVTPATLDGQSLVEERCTKCHDLGRVEQAKKTEEEWKATVERMVGKGAELNQAEQELVIKFLQETYPKQFTSNSLHGKGE